MHGKSSWNSLCDIYKQSPVFALDSAVVRTHGSQDPASVPHSGHEQPATCDGTSGTTEPCTTREEHHPESDEVRNMALQVRRKLAILTKATLRLEEANNATQLKEMLDLTHQIFADLPAYAKQLCVKYRRRKRHHCVPSAVRLRRQRKYKGKKTGIDACNAASANVSYVHERLQQLNGYCLT